jgi:hypothetical protein
MKDTETAPMMPSDHAAQCRENLKKMAGAEDNARAAADKLKVMGDAQANKHGG